jgi:hypothetical protein
VDVKPVEVTSALIEVNVTAYINHGGSKTRNASMLIRAISSDTGLLGTQVSAPIPEAESDLEKTLAVSQNLKVERNGGYELKMTVKAREAASNLLADKTDTESGVIASENTAVKSVQLVVPDGYNYMVVVELWRGNTLLNSWEKPVLLAPTKTVPKESVEKKVNIEVSKFVREGGAGDIAGKEGAYYPAATPAPAYGAPKEPGFEIFAAMAAVLAVFVLRRRL